MLSFLYRSIQSFLDNIKSLAYLYHLFGVDLISYVISYVSDIIFTLTLISTHTSAIWDKLIRSCVPPNGRSSTNLLFLLVGFKIL